MAGVLSALGIGLADTTAMREQSVEAPLTGTDAAGSTSSPTTSPPPPAPTSSPRGFRPTGSGPPPGAPALRRHRHRLAVACADPDAMTAEFEAVYRRTSFVLDAALIVEAVSVEAIGLPDQRRDWAVGSPGRRPGHAPPTPDPTSAASVRLYSVGDWRDAPLHQRETAPTRRHRDGPGDHRRGRRDHRRRRRLASRGHATGHLLLGGGAAGPHGDVGTEADPVMLEIFNNLFMSIAEQMGARLESTAQSVNIKERLDFSCALFDPDGNLVANAPHMPVHLGSMGTQRQGGHRRNAAAMRPGDVYAVNDPYHGGTHLPDVTVVTPVFERGRTRTSCSTSPRAATTRRSAASRPARCRRSAARSHEEGVLFDNWLLVADGRFREAETSATAHRGAVPVAQPRRPTSPTCGPRSPPTRRASTRSGA